MCVLYYVYPRIKNDFPISEKRKKKLCEFKQIHTFTRWGMGVPGVGRGSNDRVTQKKRTKACKKRKRKGGERENLRKWQASCKARKNKQYAWPGKNARQKD